MFAISVAATMAGLHGCAAQRTRAVEDRPDPSRSTPTPTECSRPGGTRELAVADYVFEALRAGVSRAPPRILRSAVELEQARAECELEAGVACYDDATTANELPSFAFETSQMLWFPTRAAHEHHVEWAVTNGETITVGLRREYHCMPTGSDGMMYVAVEAERTSQKLAVLVCERHADCRGAL
jgi:hypothetical protein